MKRNPWVASTVVLMVVAAMASAAALAARTPDKAPYVAKMSWGTFKLSNRIAKKIQAGQPLNIGLTMEGQTIPIYGPQYKVGFGVGIKNYTRRYHRKLNGV